MKRIVALACSFILIAFFGCEESKTICYKCQKSSGYQYIITETIRVCGTENDIQDKLAYYRNKKYGCSLEDEGNTISGPAVFYKENNIDTVRIPSK